jgi:predicted acylesterase/phospholipase RssA
MPPCTNKLGLAFSGGGFRASLYHLGLVRFLRDAGILPQVTHITSVSGGSIVAAHLVLNWDRYNGSPGEFDAAAAEVLAFVRLDVRNRIARRLPLTLPLRWPRRLLGRCNRRLTLAGMLESHYEKYLYGVTSLFELPEKPALHILATNLSEGCLCSFNRNGLLMVHRQPCNTIRLDRVHIGLATVSMAVAASSAFPGFFPPLELTGADVGATVGDFGRQAYTDGGVFDNLGVRMFRCLERPLLADSPLSREDFVDFPAVAAALREAGKSAEETPLRRLAQILVAAGRRPDLLRLTQVGPAPVPAESLAHLPASGAAGGGDGEAVLASLLGDVLRHYQMHREPLFAGLKLLDPDAEVLLGASRCGRKALEASDQLWLNRHLLEATFRQATGQSCFRRLNSGLDGVLVSDVGKPIEIQANRRAGGLIRTALRASDILMDRVWQLEIETFEDTHGFVFAPVTEVVDPAEDPTALHPEVQRQAANIRTDLDRFSLLEISSLVRHGYCVGRKACRTRPDLFGDELPGNAPWDPVPARSSAVAATRRSSSLFALLQPRKARGEPAAVTAAARTLQDSAIRRIWSTLLDYRDWVSYLYVPILVPLLVLLPYFLVRSYQRSHRLSQLVDSLASSSRDLEQMSRLLDGTISPWVGETPEEVRTVDEPDLTDFEVLQDMRILDLRNWNPAAAGKNDSSSLIYGYRRLKVFKKSEQAGKGPLRIRLLESDPEAQFRFPHQQLKPKLLRYKHEGAGPGQGKSRWEVSYDFAKVPVGDHVDLIIEYFSAGAFVRRGERSTTLTAEIWEDTAEVTRWLLLPRGKEYKNFRIVRYKTGKPDTVEAVRIVTEYLADDFTILAYKLLSVHAGYTYEVTWYYK